MDEHLDLMVRVLRQGFLDLLVSPPGIYWKEPMQTPSRMTCKSDRPLLQCCHTWSR